MVVIPCNIRIESSGMDGEQHNHEQEQRFIYFNPNFCINNINVKELVTRARSSSMNVPYREESIESVGFLPSSSNPALSRNQDLSHTPPRIALLPTPNEPPCSTFNTFMRLEQGRIPRGNGLADCDPWYPRNPSYANNLLSLAADYAIRPNQPVRCRLPPLSKTDLFSRMEKLHRQGKVSQLLKFSTHVDNFMKYMKIVKDQIEFDELQIDYTKNQTYAECRRKRDMMKRLNVNSYHYVNENVVEDLFARAQNLRCFKKKLRAELDISKVDTSKLTSKQRKFLFINHVYKQGKNKFNRLKDTPDQPELVSVSKFKAISTDSLAVKQRSQASLRYRRTSEPFIQDCRFYMTTGKCKFGVRCIRKHDPSKLPTKLKKALARRRSRSTFTVNNTAKNKTLLSHKIRELSVKNTKTQQGITRKKTSPFRIDYRFINNATLGPTKISMNKKLVRRALIWKRKTALQKKQDCMFFIRRGKCVFGDGCRKRHDVDKVALCSKFIFGNNCSTENCPYQHKLVKEKMPICLYFYVGKCSKDECPFLHVKLGTDVSVCERFSAGHCDRGSSCGKRHTRDCEHYFETGTCSSPAECKLSHEKRLRGVLEESADTDTDRPYFEGDDFIPIGN